MKLIITIVFLAMTLFLVQPTFASNKTSSLAHSCCGHKTKDKKEGNTKECNPFVNCCYRTFEVITNIVIKQPFTIKEKAVYTQYTCSERKGFINHCWHPPREVLV